MRGKKMKLAKDENGEAIVSLGKRRSKESVKEAAFGVSISRSGHADAAANGKGESPFGRLVFDETQAYYIASLDGSLISVSDQYHTLAKQLERPVWPPAHPIRLGKDQFLLSNWLLKMSLLPMQR